MLNFYMAPGSCTTGIHILLEECELIFSANIVNLPKGDQHTEQYRAINPRGTIPTLVLDDGTNLTSFESIAWWLAQTNPAKKLLPENLNEQLKVMEIMNLCVHTIHGLGFTRIFTPEKYFLNDQINTEEQKIILKNQAEKIISEGFEYLAKIIKRPYVTEQFSIADAALFYVEFWADRTNIEIPQQCISHYENMKQRPIVKQVLLEEGYRI